jgi:prepilin-type N-terminal cleavage/methylation domain-containing protein
MEKRGFTVIELSVVVGIMTMLTAVVFSNFPKFNRQLAVQREANKLAIILRKAQSFALAVREFDASNTDDPFCENPPVRFPPYGVSFSMVSGGPGDARNNKTYVIFGDINCSSMPPSVTDAYTVTDLEEVEVIRMSREVAIKSLTGYNASDCLGCALSKADATYQRPAPSVVLNGRTLFGGLLISDLDRIEIVLEIPGENLSRTVVIQTTGQVSVE